MSNDKPSQAQRPTTIDLPDLPATSDPTQIKMMSPSPEPRMGEQSYPTNVTLDPAASGTGQGAIGSSSSSSGGSSSGGGSSQSGSQSGSGGTGTSGGGAGNP
jgi:hypothetical protein